LKITGKTTWDTIQEFTDQKFSGYDQDIFKIIKSSKAASTNSKYETYFKLFKEWCIKNECLYLPASVPTVAVYISVLVKKSVSFSVLCAHFYSVKWFHDISLLKNPCEDKLIQMMMEGAKRILGRPIVKKEPITISHLQKIVEKFGKDHRHLPNVRLCAMLLISFAGFLRYNELANLKMSNIKFYDTYVNINIEKSKTDLYRRGNSITISKTGLPTCPVTWLLNYIQLANLDFNSEEYIFRSLIYLKSKKSYRLCARNTPLSYTRAREIFLKSLSDIGLNCKDFCLHSLRSGGATAAANNGLSDRLIKAHGRWRSDVAKDGYIKDNFERQCIVSRKLGI
jgi:integrase